MSTFPPAPSSSALPAADSAANPVGAKSSLREFQRRLAARLSQASNTQVATHLAVEVGKRRLLFPLAEAGEISTAIVLQPLPHAKPWFIGVSVLRGEIVGVVDLAVLLGEKTQASSAGTFVALGEALDVNCLLRVDSLAGLRSLDQFKVNEAKPQGDFGTQYLDEQQRVWEELSPALLAQNEQFLQVYA